MISSAVVIPEQPPQAFDSSPSASRKRRQSSISSDGNKRPRLETQGLYANARHGSPPSASAGSPPSAQDSRRKSTTVEEKKRGQRLFGSLLGTLSRTDTKPTHRKRDEIEKRQLERIKRDNDEREEERRRKREELNRVRRIEQGEWDEESTRIRYANMMAMAGFLRTKVEPALYYRPWELRPEEEEQIKQQKADVEKDILREVKELKGESSKDDGLSTSLPTKATVKEGENGDVPMAEFHEDERSQNGVPKTEEVDITTIEAEGAAASVSSPHEASPSTKEARPKDDDHGGEELVEGREDDVIY